MNTNWMPFQIFSLKDTMFKAILYIQINEAVRFSLNLCNRWMVFSYYEKVCIILYQVIDVMFLIDCTKE